MNYPDQDPRELRADVVNTSVDRVIAAVTRVLSAADDYRRTYGDPRAPEEFRVHAHRTQQQAATDVGRICEEHRRLMLEIADSSTVPVVHEVEHG